VDVLAHQLIQLLESPIKAAKRRAGRRRRVEVVGDLPKKAERMAGLGVICLDHRAELHEPLSVVGMCPTLRDPGDDREHITLFRGHLDLALDPESRQLVEHDRERTPVPITVSLQPSR
jgi:hypothetical protein